MPPYPTYEVVLCRVRDFFSYRTGAHAHEKASVINYREESDGMIREMYVW